MSSHHSEKITCRKCKKESTFILYDSVNVSLDPELKEKVLDRSLFLFKCPECGTEIYLEYGILYHDIDKHIMIYVCADPENGNNIPQRILLEVQEMKYMFRTVSETVRLVEKIKIFDAGLDDFAIEIFKAWIWNRIEGEKELFFDETDNKNLEFIVRFKDGACNGFSIGYTGYKECKKIADSFPDKEQVQYIDAKLFLEMFEGNK